VKPRIVRGFSFGLCFIASEAISPTLAPARAAEIASSRCALLAMTADIASVIASVA
jgi:hypothetical protein